MNISEVSFVSKKLAKNPIINEPITLTNNVPMGKQGKYTFKKLDKPYLKQAPKAPPNATNKKLINKLN